MKTSSDFTVDEIGKLITISNLLGVQLPETKSGSVDFYLNAIIDQLKSIPYHGFPIAIHCVDVAILNLKEQGLKNRWSLDDELLFGRKLNSSKYCFIGGFVNPGENAHDAASRELKEETGIEVDDQFLDYVSSNFIDDDRFKNGPHKLITSLFIVGVFSKLCEIKANDDIEEVKWITIETLKNTPNVIVDEHQVLLKQVLEKFYHE